VLGSDGSATRKPNVLRLSALVHLYFHLYKGIFYHSHRDSILYIYFFRIRVISIPYSIPNISYFILLSPPFSLSPTLPLSCYSAATVYRSLLTRASSSVSLCGRYAAARVTDARYTTVSIPAALPLRAADSLMPKRVYRSIE
jgi:hypothetical protein